jgi:hypothetical protein
MQRAHSIDQWDDTGSNFGSHQEKAPAETGAQMSASRGETATT